MDSKWKWIMRAVIVNLVCLGFIIANHEGLDQAVFRIVFCNLFCMGVFLLADSVVGLVMNKLDKHKENDNEQV